MRYILAVILIAGLLVGCDDSTTTQALLPVASTTISAATPTSEPAPTPDSTPDPTATPTSDSTPIPTPAPTATPTTDPTSKPTSEPTATPTILQSTVNAIGGLNVRTEPRTQARVLRVLPFKAKVKLSGKSRLSEGLRWVQLADGGWVQERYLFPDATPSLEPTVTNAGTKIAFMSDRDGSDKLDRLRPGRSRHRRADGGPGGAGAAPPPTAPAAA